jgi:hypothetical protein
VQTYNEGIRENTGELTIRKRKKKMVFEEKREMKHPFLFF